MAKIGIWDTFVSERPSAAIPPKPERAAKEKVSKKAQARAAEAAATPAPEPTPALQPAPTPEPAPTEPAPVVEAEEQAPPAEGAAEETSEA